jgi:hypothetical protein
MSLEQARERLQQAIQDEAWLEERYGRLVGTSGEQAAYQRLKDAHAHVVLCSTALRLLERPEFGRPAIRSK